MKVAEVNEASRLVQSLEPHGADDASIDDKGRLRLPAKHVAYLKELKEETVFITTLNPNHRMSVIYPITGWVSLQNSLNAKAQTSPELAKAIKVQRRIASHFGGTSSIDAQGRVLVPAELRKTLGLDGKRVKIDFELGRYNFWVAEEYSGVYGAALNEIDSANEVLEGTGLL